jgi:carboxyl-terminal processing protease
MTTKMDYQTWSAEIGALLQGKLFHPYYSGRDLQNLISRCLTQLKTDPSTSPEEFEQSVRRGLKMLEISHTGFWNGTGQALPVQFGLNAILTRYNELWIFRTVLPGGIAEQAGIKTGETLLSINDVPLGATEPRFELGQFYRLSLLERDGQTHRSLTITLPGTGPGDRPPMVEPTPFTSALVAPGIGLLRVATFPGAIGFDFARALSRAAADLTSRGCNRLIVDLRGNCGGGLGSLRLMSLLTPGRLPIGYSLTRTAKESQRKTNSLATIRKIPATKWGLTLMGLRFKFLQLDRSVRLITEGLGPQPFHNRTVVLIDEYTRSAAEMVAAFIKKHKLAQLVGTKTPGETLGAANFSIGSMYKLRIPVVGWYTAEGQLIEGQGVSPDIEVNPTLEQLRAGADPSLERAMQLVSALWASKE